MSSLNRVRRDSRFESLTKDLEGMRSSDPSTGGPNFRSLTLNFFLGTCVVEGLTSRVLWLASVD